MIFIFILSINLSFAENNTDVLMESAEDAEFLGNLSDIYVSNEGSDSLGDGQGVGSGGTVVVAVFSTGSGDGHFTSLDDGHLALVVDNINIRISTIWITEYY